MTKLTKLDSLMRWLDNGYYVVMWGNKLGSYSAALVKREEITGAFDDNQPILEVDESRFTDDMTPTKSLIALADKPLQTQTD